MSENKFMPSALKSIQQSKSPSKSKPESNPQNKLNPNPDSQVNDGIVKHPYVPSSYVMSLQNKIDDYNRNIEKFPQNAAGTIGTRYHCRAECPRDAELFLRTILWFIEPSWTMSPITYYPDVEVTFSIREEISPLDLLWIASSIVDGHVLVQTLEKEDCYTGNRDYERDIELFAPEYRPSASVLADMKKGTALYIKSLKYLLSDAKEFAANFKAMTN